MAGLNITNATTLYTNYLDGIDRSLNDKSKMRTLVKQDKPWKGSHLEWRVHVRRSGAVGPNQDGGALQTPNFQTHATAKASRKFMSGKVQLTEGIMATGSGNKNVAGDAVNIEVEGLENDLLKMENGLFFRDGTAAIATMKTGTTGTTLYVDDARMFCEGCTYDVYDSTLATNYGTVTVSSVTQAYDNTNGRATVTTTATVPNTTAGNLIVLPGGVNLAMSGLQKLITDSGTLQNISATTYPRHTSLILSSGTSRNLTPALFRQMQAGLFQKTGSDDPSKVLDVYGSAFQLMKIDELWESEMRVTPTDKTGGLAMPYFQSSFGRFRTNPDADATYGRLFFVDFSQIYRGVQKKLHWRGAEEGGTFWNTSQVSLVKEASVLEIQELYIRNRTSSGQITDLIEDNKSVAF